MKSDANPLAELDLDPEEIHVLDDADFEAFTAQLDQRRVELVVAADSDGEDAEAST